ncbi:MAG: hypothetical protein A2Y79_07835 [Deltaproteobacteria bacterium RBG_13_43_22]|nr:MAG: hypothetical protein A2Y79_07835 [Deltaproteobacteria bacterium RBG_13_43_22]
MNTLRSVNRSYTVSDEDHIITAGTETYQFDADGFLTSKTSGSNTSTYQYSSRGELLSATLPNGTTIAYDHDPMGRRIAKRSNGTITEKYLWKDAITLLAVYDASDNLLMRFTYADGRMPISMTYNGSTYYLSYDQIGSLKAVTDLSGNVVKKIDYDSFGNILSETNPTMNIPFGFAGGLHDRNTNIVRFGARDYDPTLGRWTAKDPIDFLGGDTNLYGYVQNDPVTFFDPKGKTGQEIEFAIKTILPLIFGAVEVTNPSTLKSLGYGGDLLEIISGGSGILTAEIIATGSPSVPWLFPAFLAGLGGWEIGTAFNRIWERISGQSLGADIYDWLHPNNEEKRKCH